jgi:hypothetical protein
MAPLIRCRKTRSIFDCEADPRQSDMPTTNVLREVVVRAE